MDGRCLWSISVALSFENVWEIYISDGAQNWEGLNLWLAACLQVKSRLSNFGRLEKCLKKQKK